MFLGYSVTQHNFYRPFEKSNILTDIKKWYDERYIPETYFYQIPFDKLMSNLGYSNELINDNIDAFVRRTCDNKIGSFIFKNGGLGLEYYSNRQLDFIKAYKFLKTQPNLFYAPVTLFSVGEGLYSFHPGSAKMQLANLFKVSPTLTVIFTPYDSFTSHSHIHSVLERYSIRKANTSDKINKISNMINLDMHKGNPVQLKLLKFEDTDITTIEISEDHRDIPGFVDDDDYIVEIDKNLIRVNTEVILYKENNIWKTCL